MTGMLDLPRECLYNIFFELEHLDLARLRQSCTVLNDFIADNDLLYRRLYLKHWDDPRPGTQLHGSEWRLLGEKFAHVLRRLRPKAGVKATEADLLRIERDIKGFLAAANPLEGHPSRNASVLASYFDDPVVGGELLCQSTTFERTRSIFSKDVSTRSSTAARAPINALSAKLHCLYGPHLYDDWLDDRKAYAVACSRVYDLRNYTLANIWGPFKDDGSLDVDWEKMEAVMLIIGHNVKQHRTAFTSVIPELWHPAFEGAWPNSYRSRSARQLGIRLVRPFPESLNPNKSLRSQDPYDVTGTYARIVCFLDYQDLFRYNFDMPQPPPGQPRPPIDIPGATRMITMQIVVTEIESPSEEEDDPDHPVVVFRGVSRAVRRHPWEPNANSLLRGSVRRTKEGEIRWTTFSVYDGEERWRSESIQIGGIRSARGGFGYWFDRNYDEEGPAGPTAFWKISDDYDAEDDEDADSDDSVDMF